MLTTEQFFAAFDAAGFLHSASWTPSGGGAPQTASVRFMTISHDGLSNQVSVTDYTIQYPQSQLSGLKRGETLVIGAASYKVRETPVLQLDGTRVEAHLERLP